MFCPRCQAEYLPHVHRCSDCEVPLVEHLPVRHGDSERTRVFTFAPFKELGVFIVIPVTVLATLIVPLALRDNPFAIQIAAIIGYTGCVFLFVFCDVGPGRVITKKAKGTKGFSLGEKAVRQKLPLLMPLHALFLVLLFAGVTGALWLRPRTWFLWHLDTPYFDFILLCIGVAIAFVQIHLFRGILGRAIEHEQRVGRS